MVVTEKQVLDALSVVIDPDLGRDIVSLGFIKNLVIEEAGVRFDLELTTPACPLKAHFKKECEQALQKIGAGGVTINFTARHQPKKQAPAVNTLENVDAIIAVSSCKGGVGKSTIAVHLARALQREGHKVGLLDADIYGPSFPTLFGIHAPDIQLIDNKITPVEVEGLKIMSFGFLLGDSPAVLRGPIVSGYIQQLLTQTDWGKLDFLIIDMPPGTGDIQLTITQSAPLDGALIVTTPQTLSLVDVAKGILMFEKVEVPVLGLVENMSYFVCDGCSKKHFIFGSGTHTLRERFGIETLAEIPVIPNVSHADGHLIDEPMRILAENMHRAIGKRRVGAVSPMVSAAPGFLNIRWPDGAQSTLPNAKVRASCTCAQCVNEFTGEPILDPASVPEDIAIEDIQQLGNYAVSITWSDGHGSGIYSWDRLRYLTTTEKGTTTTA